MSSSRVGAFRKPLNGDSSYKGKTMSDYQPTTHQLPQGFAQVNLNPKQDDDDGQWEVYAKKSKNKAGSSTAKPRNHGGFGRASGNLQQTQNASSFRRPAAAGRGNGRSQIYESNNVASTPLIRPPLEHGWNWQSRPGSKQSNGVDIEAAPESPVKNNDDFDDAVSDVVEDTDDDLMSDDYDSDISQSSHESRKKNKWFYKFFQNLDGLSVEQINDPEREWHCPACQGGPGAVLWYTGLQPLMTHAKTKGSKRVKIHREFADLLDEELRRRGTSVIPPGEAFGKWKGLTVDQQDHEIVWPPMVIIQNTQLEQDENEKWVGMGNQELLDYFRTYDAVKARHSYGPQGHRGTSVLIFEGSATGYLEADRLHRHFVDQGTDRDAWFGRRKLFLPGGKRQLYGYMAVKEDLVFFNRHSQGKSRLKYDMRSYQDMVVKQFRQMSEDNQQLIYFKDKVAKEQRHAKALEASFGIVSEKLRKTMEENRIVRLRTKKQHEENKEEMYMQEEFFREQLRNIHDSRNAKEEDFERMQQEKREQVKQSSASPLNAEEGSRKVQEYLKFVELQDKEMDKFVAEEEELRQAHEENIAAMRRRHWEEEVQLEKKFDEELAKLMKKYSPSRSESK
ncbi:Protein SUPPRESSOR OF GENE SILENCING [Stylosanthes scabra]|uniref:Protein SUPPRESSOR OF GENE SILENCING n=1 Tax=Stylosanthes scabra TaxID=79078 RepID=A0ABU6X2C9_9FABA|nr:Protein SUPPRESSOR OF GENE SILENCING [Stylosanthes scabra]